MTYLGIKLNRKLNFGPHIRDKINKVCKYLFALRSVVGHNWGLKPKLASCAYKACVFPKLTYITIVWEHSLNKHEINRFAQLSGIAARMATSAYKSSPITGLEVI